MLASMSPDPATRIPAVRPRSTRNPVREYRMAAVIVETEATRAGTSGHKPASSGVWARKMKKTPNPTPAATARPIPVRSDPVSPPQTSQIAGIATAMPANVRLPGRSPSASPATTGNAAPTSEATGATTAIRPVARPW